MVDLLIYFIGKSAYIFYLQWIIDISTVCSRIISDIHYFNFIPCLLILFAGISSIDVVKILSPSLNYQCCTEHHVIHLLQEYTVLLADDAFKLIENQNWIANKHRILCPLLRYQYFLE